MTPLVVGLLLFAAFLHASWNSILRAGSDRLWTITVMGVVGGGAALIAAILLPPPAPASWPFLAFSSVLQTAYSLFLIRAYRHGELGHVYPIARGVAPVLVTLGAWLAAREAPTPPGLAGVALVSGGVMVLALGRDRPDRPTLLAALATGGFIAAYTVTDGMGVRVSGGAIAYAAWLAVIQGAGLLAVYVALRRRWPAAPRGREGFATAIAAVIGVLGYGIALWAMSLAPMSQVSALRETSILFAAVLGTVLLREPLTPARLIGAASIAAGATCISAF